MNNKKIIRNMDNDTEEKEFIITDNMILQIDEKKCFVDKRHMVFAE